MLNNEASAAIAINLLASISAANTAGATGAWTDLNAIPLEGYVLFLLNVGALTGSLAAVIQDADDKIGTNLATVSNGTFAASVANTPQKAVVLRTAMRRWVRVLGTVVTGPVVLSATALCRAKSF
jgi:hypothetical protein